MMRALMIWCRLCGEPTASHSEREVERYKLEFGFYPQTLQVWVDSEYKMTGQHLTVQVHGYNLMTHRQFDATETFVVRETDGSTPDLPVR